MHSSQRQKEKRSQTRAIMYSKGSRSDHFYLLYPLKSNRNPSQFCGVFLFFLLTHNKSIAKKTEKSWCFKKLSYHKYFFFYFQAWTLCSDRANNGWDAKHMRSRRVRSPTVKWAEHGEHIPLARSNFDQLNITPRVQLENITEKIQSLSKQKRLWRIP